MKTQFVTSSRNGFAWRGGPEGGEGERWTAIAQDPKTAKFPSMPENAIATGPGGLCFTSLPQAVRQGKRLD
jgi:hypothetical protein